MSEKESRLPGIIWGCALLLVGICTLGYQGYEWLKYGQWPAIDLRNLTDPGVSAWRANWVGIDEILLWFGRRSVALMTILFGIVTLIGSQND
jgi:hypothetical protein